MARRLAARAVYWFLTTLTRVVVSTFTRLEVVGRERVPREGGVLLVANHLHLIDPPLVATSCPRRVRTMAKRELFRTPLLGWILWPYGAFPVRRYSADIGALRAARDLLRGGSAVLIFPEGTRSKDARLHPAHSGAGMVALLAQATVVPVAITGTEGIRVPGSLFRWRRRDRPRICVEFGEPFDVPASTADARRAEQATDLLMRRVAALLPSEYQGAYAGPPTAVPVVAREARGAAPAR